MTLYIAPSSDRPEEISIRETSPGSWRITFNGKILGDSRGYDRARAWQVAQEIVRKNHAEAAAECRHATRVLRPPF